MTTQPSRSLSMLLPIFVFAFSYPAHASRLAYEQVGHVTEIAPASGEIKINDTSYSLAKKVTVHSTDKPANPITVESLHAGMSIGYTSTRTSAGTGKDAGKKPEITSIWLLPKK